MVDQVQHFGLSQTEATLIFEAGELTLQTIFGDKYHTPHDPTVFGDSIIVTVQ